jgi:protein gp37
MAEATKIQWTSSTWNPWRGCTKVHAGCDHCYAEAWSHRNPAQLGVWGDEGTRVSGADSMWNAPLRWQRQAEKTGVRHSCFPSLMDPFEDRADLVPLRERMFRVIDQCPLVDFLLLTKRPENVRRMWPLVGTDIVPPAEMERPFASELDIKRFRSNVWVGTSISDQATVDKYVPELLKLRDLSAVLFLSAEPLVGPVQFASKGVIPASGDHPEMYGFMIGKDDGESLLQKTPEEALAKSGLDWVIVGGESGPKARPCDVDWVQSIVEQCKSASVPVFVKQLGAVVRSDKSFELDDDGGEPAKLPLRLRDPKGGDPDEWPEDLRVREFPDRKGVAP